jgi:hypothetical protein
MMVLFILAMLPGVRAGSARVYEKCAEILWTKTANIIINRFTTAS